MKSQLFLTPFLFSATAFAAEHGAEHAIVVPTATVVWQAIDIAVVALVLYFALRKSVPEFFRQRRDGYLASAKKAESAKVEAEKQFLEIKHKLAHLETTYDESLARAEAEAADMRKQLQSEAQEQARRIREESEITVKMEALKAQRDLKDQFVTEAIASARRILSKDIGSSDHQKLQAEFARNIEAVSP